MAKPSNTLPTPALSREQVRHCDQVAIERYHIDERVLMENAGSAAAARIRSLYSPEATPQALIFAGPGNNGGDGFVVARHLANAGWPVEVILCVPRDRIRGTAEENLRIIEHMAITISSLPTEPGDAAGTTDHSTSSPSTAAISRFVADRVHEVPVVIDAMLGTGTAGPPREPIRTVIDTLNRCLTPSSGSSFSDDSSLSTDHIDGSAGNTAPNSRQGRFEFINEKGSLPRTIIALDIPSGLDCDTGQPLETALLADHTITFLAVKKGFLALNAARYTGEVTVGGIGIDLRYLLESSPSQ